MRNSRVKGKHRNRLNLTGTKKGQKICPQWDTLNPVMVRRFLEWWNKHEARWGEDYVVYVRVVYSNNGNTVVKMHAFKFEERADAVRCEQWWRELNYVPIIKVL